MPYQQEKRTTISDFHETWSADSTIMTYQLKANFGLRSCVAYSLQTMVNMSCT